MNSYNIIKSFEKYVKQQLNEQAEHEGENTKFNQADENHVILDDDTVLTFSENFPAGVKVYEDSEGNRFIIGTEEDMINYAAVDLEYTVDQAGAEVIPWSFLVSHYIHFDNGNVAEDFAEFLKTNSDGNFAIKLIKDLAGSVHNFMKDFIDDKGYFDLHGVVDAKSSKKRVKDNNKLVVLEIIE